MTPKPPRRNFPASVKRAALERSGGTCEAHLVPSKYGLPAECAGKGQDYDHICPDAEGGPPTLGNCAHLCKPCHALKTPQDKRIAAKIARLAGRTGQLARRRRNGPQIKSRGFQKPPPGYVSPLRRKSK